jgi:hypothetical protein
MYKCTRFKGAELDETSQEAFEDYEPEEIIKPKKSNIMSLFEKTDDESESSILSMVETALTANLPVPPDLRVRDANFKQAPNFITWATDSSYAGNGVPPFPRQIEIGTNLFSEFCPRPKCTDADWWENKVRVNTPIAEMQSRVSFLEFGVCPKCKSKRSDLILNNKLENYYSLIGLAGQRAAKTSSVVLWESYNLHKMVLLPNPSTAFGTLATQPIVSTFVAMTFNQAVENIWIPFRNILTTAPWYQDYFSFLNDEGKKLGEELYQLGENSLRFRHRNLIYAPTGPNKRTGRGRTRFSALLDEFGWFPLFSKQNKELERLDAQGVDIAMTRSLFTLKSAHRRRMEEGFDDMPRPMKYMVSSPSAINDYIMTSYRKALGSSEILRFKYKSWEYNPLLRKKDFAEEFRNDPVAAARDYECNPPMGEGLFITDTLGLEKCAKGKNAYKVHTTLSQSKSGSMTTSSEIEILREPRNPHACILSIDVGIVNNSFAFSVITLPENYVEPSYDENDSESEDYDSDSDYLVPVRVLGVGEVIPKAGAPLSLTQLYNKCLRPLVEFFDCRVLVSDRWQNAKIASDLNEKYGIENYEVRAKWQDFIMLRELINQHQIELPKPEKALDVIQQTLLDNYPEIFQSAAQDHLYWQLMSVREQTNVTVVKPDSGTDDLFRTIVLGASLLQDEDVRDLIYQKGGPEENIETGSLTIAKGFSKSIKTAARTISTSSSGGALALVRNRRP